MAQRLPTNLRAYRRPAHIADVPYLYINNIVTTFNTWHTTPHDINIRGLSRSFPGISFNPKKFAACTIRCQNGPTILLFSSGSGVCAGARTTMEARNACALIISFMQRAGEIATYANFRVQNIVCNAEAGFLIHLKGVKDAYDVDASWEPAKFPGLIFRMRHEPYIVMIVFVSGRVIVTGSRHYSDSCKAWEWFFVNVLMTFRMRNEAQRHSAATYRMALLHHDAIQGARALHSLILDPMDAAELAAEEKWKQRRSAALDEPKPSSRKRSKATGADDGGGDEQPAAPPPEDNPLELRQQQWLSYASAQVMRSIHVDAGAVEVGGNDEPEAETATVVDGGAVDSDDEVLEEYDPKAMAEYAEALAATVLAEGGGGEEETPAVVETRAELGMAEAGKVFDRIRRVAAHNYDVHLRRTVERRVGKPPPVPSFRPLFAAGEDES
jgi:TATA-box binding protein (TBP) (component of TFIID and TFIIIB)